MGYKDLKIIILLVSKKIQTDVKCSAKNRFHFTFRAFRKRFFKPLVFIEEMSIEAIGVKNFLLDLIFNLDLRSHL